MKLCNGCGTEKPHTEFHKNRTAPDGLQYQCKSCKSSRQKLYAVTYRDKWLATKRRANARMSTESRAHKKALNKQYAHRLRDATPAWANREEMTRIHRIATDAGLEVDHIVPITSPVVCGLNVPSNLRCISQQMNRKKYNTFNQDYLSAMQNEMINEALKK